LADQGLIDLTYFLTCDDRTSFDARPLRRFCDARSEKTASATKAVSLKQKLADLTLAFEAGLVSEEHYRKKKEEPLAQL
jgi:hypothetical protein